MGGQESGFKMHTKVLHTFISLSMHVNLLVIPRFYSSGFFTKHRNPVSAKPLLPWWTFNRVLL